MNTTRLWNKKYILLMIVNFFNAFSFYMIVSLLSIYLTGIGISLSVAGMVIGLFSITSLVLRPVTGVMTDTLDKKKLIIVATLLTVIGTFGYFMTQSLPLIIVLRIIHGAGFAINSTAVIALATAYIPKDRLGEGVGYFGIGQVVSGAIGPAIGSQIADALGINFTFAIAGCFSIVAVVMMLLFRTDETVTNEKKIKRIHLNNLIAFEVLHLALISGAFSLVNGIVASYLLMFGKERNISNVSLYFTVYAVFMFLLRPASGKIMDRKGLNAVAYPGMIIAAVGMFLLGKAYTLPVVIIAAVLRAVGQGAAQPSMQAACMKKGGKDRVGIANSTFYLGGDIGQGLGPTIGGIVISKYGYEQLFTMTAVVLAIGVIIYIFTEGKKDNK